MITLRPVGLDQYATLAHLRVRDEQIKYAGTLREAFETGEKDVDFHAIEWDGAPVGFFKIDRAYPAEYDFACDGEIGLRGFLIDASRQGQGIASAAVLALPAYLTGQYPLASAVVLSVNCANPAAIRCYLKGGFVDTGDLYQLGRAGPQHVMRMTLG